MPTVRFALLFILIPVLGSSGCRLLVEVPRGGYVATQSGTLHCAPTQTCPIEVVDTAFNERFVAVPHTGYIFTGWRQQGLHFCGGKTGACTLATSAARESPELMAALASDQVFFLSPYFERGFTSNLGVWEGNWLSTTSDKAGRLSLTLAKVGKTKVRFTLALKHSTNSPDNSTLMTIIANQRPNGNLYYKGNAEISGVSQTVVFNHSKTGVLSVSIASKAIAAHREIGIEGVLRGGVMFVRYSLETSTNNVFQGTATAYRS